MTYKEELLDPRWQKKRLKILERDNFTCQECGETESTLHVHHKKYFKGKAWEINDKYLITLCKNCHESETNDKKLMIIELKKNIEIYNSNELNDLIVLLDLIGEENIHPQLETIIFARNELSTWEYVKKLVANKSEEINEWLINHYGDKIG